MNHCWNCRVVQYAERELNLNRLKFEQARVAHCVLTLLSDLIDARMSAESIQVLSGTMSPVGDQGSGPWRGRLRCPAIAIVGFFFGNVTRSAHRRSGLLRGVAILAHLFYGPSLSIV